MGKYASEVINAATEWLGCKEQNGTHRQIIDIYNSQKPLPRGYKVKYTDEWCAAFVSAVAIKLGYTDIIPTECGCPQLISLFMELDSWMEEDSYIPKGGDIIFYDWEDSGKGDNKGRPNHVGIVEKVSKDRITVIEGNYNESVRRRSIKINAKHIRGYGLPKYDKAESSLPEIIYQVFTKERGWLPNVDGESDYAGLPRQSIRCIFASLSKGNIEYQVHTVGGRWLPWVRNREDFAGLYSRDVDCVRVRLLGNPDFSVQCRVAPIGRDYYPWVTDNNDYAGVYGRKIDRLQMRIIKKN